MPRRHPAGPDAETMDERQDQTTGVSSNNAPADAGAGDAQPHPARRRSAHLDQHLDTDALSAYLDNQLDAPELTTAASHLARCEACQGDLAELRTTIKLLGGLPQYRPRRSFELGPEYASGTRSTRFSRLLPLLPALRVAAATVALLLMGVIAADIRFSDDMPASIPQAAPGTTSTAPSERGATEGLRSSEDRSAADEAGTGAGAAEPAGEQADRALEAAPAAVPTAVNSNPTADTSIAAPAQREPVADGAPSTGGNRPSAWRLAEVGLALVLLWLLVGLIGLQRLKRTGNHRAGTQRPL